MSETIETPVSVVRASSVLASRLIGSNPPLQSGIIPGSVRSVVSESLANGSKMTGGRTFTLTLNELDGDAGLLGSESALVVRCVARYADGSPILPNDPISLREEAPTLLWDQIQLSINGVEVNPCDRSDVARHVIDRLFTDPSRNLGTIGPTSWRQIGKDASLFNRNVTEYFKKSIIADANEFELYRPLTDLPFMGPQDGLIPGFFTVKIKAKSTSRPERVFVTDGPAAPLGTPYLEIVSVQIRSRSVQLQPLIATELRNMASLNELTMDADIWAATVLSPGLSAGVSSYVASPNTAFSTVPDVVAFVMFPDVSFNPSGDASLPAHPLRHVWNGIKTASLKKNGHCVKVWEKLNDRQKAQAFESLNDAWYTSAGAQHSSLAPLTLGTTDSEVFAADVGTGALVLAFRNFGEKHAHEIAPISLKFEAQFDSASVDSSTPFIVSKTRHRWNLSLSPGATRQLV